MRLIVLRHGATSWNESGRLQGRADPPLSEAGRRRVLAWSVPADWRRLPCLVSPLLRARQTAELLAVPEYQTELALVEMDWGSFEGQRLADLRASLGQSMADNEARGLDFRPPGGESPRDVTKRLAGWLGRMAAHQPSCLVVTHKGVRRALLAMATGWDMRRPPPVKLRDDEAMIVCRGSDGGLTLSESLSMGGAT